VVKRGVDFRVLRLTSSSPEEKAKGSLCITKGKTSEPWQGSGKCKSKGGKGLRAMGDGLVLLPVFELADVITAHGSMVGVSLQVANESAYKNVCATVRTGPRDASVTEFVRGEEGRGEQFEGAAAGMTRLGN
jgi:hypothetical protein